MKCYQCQRSAMFLVGPEGKQIPLCLECNLKFVQLTAMQNDMLEREINYLADCIDMTTGLPGITPRFPQRKVIRMGDITLNNIKVDRSIIGVLNTGNIQTVDSAVTALQQSGDEQLSSAILELCQSVISNISITEDLKNQILEILSLLATEVTAPKEKRRSGIMKKMLSELENIIGVISGLSGLWERIKPILYGAF